VSFDADRYSLTFAARKGVRKILMSSFARTDMDADPAISNYVIIRHFGGKIGHVTPETVGLRRM
jgi:hypothetical protein